MLFAAWNWMCHFITADKLISSDTLPLHFLGVILDNVQVTSVLIQMWQLRMKQPVSRWEQLGPLMFPPESDWIIQLQQTNRCHLCWPLPLLWLVKWQFAIHSALNKNGVHKNVSSVHSTWWRQHLALETRKDYLNSIPHHMARTGQSNLRHPPVVDVHKLYIKNKCKRSQPPANLFTRQWQIREAASAAAKSSHCRTEMFRINCPTTRKCLNSLQHLYITYSVLSRIG